MSEKFKFNGIYNLNKNQILKLNFIRFHIEPNVKLMKLRIIIILIQLNEEGWKFVDNFDIILIMGYISVIKIHILKSKYFISGVTNDKNENIM